MSLKTIPGLVALLEGLTNIPSCGMKTRVKIDMSRSLGNSPHEGILGSELVLVKGS